jgi:predicted nucleic acid-binding protein
MATDGRSGAIIETSVLVNFLKIGRTDLLAKHPTHRFVVPDLVRSEVTRHYAVQVARLDAAIAAGELLPDNPAESTDPAELAAFAAMSTVKIGDGERAAIAAAATRGLPLAMDDHRAWKRSSSFSAAVPREDTVSLIVSLIKAGVLSVAEADTIKADWQANHKFTLTFGSFAERI